MPMDETTREVYTCIDSFVKNKGYSPTYLEIAKAVGLKSKSGAAYHVRILEWLGYVAHKRNRQRTVHVIKPLPGI
jgi:SOS-response transcriptional repressor LexA